MRLHLGLVLLNEALGGFNRQSKVRKLGLLRPQRVLEFQLQFTQLRLRHVLCRTRLLNVSLGLLVLRRERFQFGTRPVEALSVKVLLHLCRCRPRKRNRRVDQHPELAKAGKGDLEEPFRWRVLHDRRDLEKGGIHVVHAVVELDNVNLALRHLCDVLRHQRAAVLYVPSQGLIARLVTHHKARHVLMFLRCHHNVGPELKVLSQDTCVSRDVASQRHTLKLVEGIGHKLLVRLEPRDFVLRLLDCDDHSLHQLIVFDDRPNGLVYHTLQLHDFRLLLGDRSLYGMDFVPQRQYLVLRGNEVDIDPRSKLHDSVDLGVYRSRTEAVESVGMQVEGFAINVWNAHTNRRRGRHKGVQLGQQSLLSVACVVYRDVVLHHSAQKFRQALVADLANYLQSDFVKPSSDLRLGVLFVVILGQYKVQRVDEGGVIGFAEHLLELVVVIIDDPVKLLLVRRHDVVDVDNDEKLGLLHLGQEALVEDVDDNLLVVVGILEPRDVEHAQIAHRVHHWHQSG
mmetsp:Transcript_7189/g.18448  ORF Transcript_7189/g.18448 Transcript_7189/m.18448 type:complete len:512 (-) Transcript_7189:566-2101(-)